MAKVDVGLKYYVINEIINSSSKTNLKKKRVTKTKSIVTSKWLGAALSNFADIFHSYIRAK